MKAYLNTIKTIQSVMLAVAIAILAILPSLIVLTPQILNRNALYYTAHFALFLVMSVRPLADLLPKIRFIRPLVILRKGFGVFSASIVVSFIIAKTIVDPAGYLGNFGTPAYWSLNNLALLAHLSDLSAIILLITSNNLSKRLLGKNWKRVQRLSYVYFYGSTLYVLFMLSDYTVIPYLLIVTGLTYFAFVANRERRIQAAQAKKLEMHQHAPL